MAGPEPAVAAARVVVRAALADLRPGDSGTPGPLVLVACSGGADSVALAVATAFVAPRMGLRAGAVIVDHGLQPGSDRVAAKAAEVCRQLELDPVIVRAVEVTDGPGGPEALARDARYEALRSVAADVDAAAVLLGHTLDDQAESVLLGLARGSGARSLAGMPARRGVFRRPFLGLRRTQTEEVCRAVEVDYWTDPTNIVPTGPARPADRRSTEQGGAGTDSGVLGGAGPRRDVDVEAPDQWPRRSVVRGRVLPVLTEVLGPGVVPALARSADLLRDDADLLDSLAADLLAEVRLPSEAAAPAPDPPPPAVGVAPPPPPLVVLDAHRLSEAPPALRRRVLRAAALDAGCPAGDLFAVHVDALDALVVRWRGQGPVHLPGDLRGVRVCGRLLLRTPALQE